MKRTRREPMDLRSCPSFKIIESGISQENETAFLEKVESWFPEKRSVCTVYGKQCTVPRDQVVMGMNDYKFSGQVVPSMPWSPVLLKIKKEVEDLYEKPVDFSYCLINGYNPEDSVGAHQDNEPCIDQTQPIASVTILAKGATPRPFDVFAAYTDGKMRGKMDTSEKWRTVLKSRSVVFMMPGAQQKFYHMVPKRKSAKKRRYNLTFRCCVKNP